MAPFLNNRLDRRKIRLSDLLAGLCQLAEFCRERLKIEACEMTGCVIKGDCLFAFGKYASEVLTRNLPPRQVSSLISYGEACRLSQLSSESCGRSLPRMTISR
jgi:hypothetical protein